MELNSPSLAEPECQVEQGTGKGDGGDDAPHRFTAHTAEIFLQDIDNGPDGEDEKRNADSDNHL